MARTFYWNDDSMSLSYKGIDYVNGQEIPADYQKEQPGKFEKFKKTLQISEKPRVEFGEKKLKELEVSRASVNKLKERISVLIKEKSELQKIADKHEANIETLENIETVNEELAEAREELKQLADAQKKIGEFDSFLGQLEPILKQDSISKDDKTALLEMLEPLKGGE